MGDIKLFTVRINTRGPPVLVNSIELYIRRYMQTHVEPFLQAASELETFQHNQTPSNAHTYYTQFNQNKNNLISFIASLVLVTRIPNHGRTAASTRDIFAHISAIIAVLETLNIERRARAPKVDVCFCFRSEVRRRRVSRYAQLQLHF